MATLTAEVAPVAVAAPPRTPLDDLADCEAALVGLDNELGCRARWHNDPFARGQATTSRRALGLLRAALTALTAQSLGTEVVAVACCRCGRLAPPGAMLPTRDGADWRCRDRAGCKAEAARGGGGPR